MHCVEGDTRGLCDSLAARAILSARDVPATQTAQFGTRHPDLVLPPVANRSGRSEHRAYELSTSDRTYHRLCELHAAIEST